MEPGIVGTHERDAALAPETPHHLAVAAFEHLDHCPLHPRVASAREWPHQRAVAVHEASHLPPSEVDALSSLVGRQESMAVGMSVHRSPQEVWLPDQGVALLADARDLAIALHGEETPRQGPQFVRLREAERGGDGIEVHRRPFFGTGRARVHPAPECPSPDQARGASGRIGVLSQLVFLLVGGV